MHAVAATVSIWERIVNRSRVVIRPHSRSDVGCVCSVLERDRDVPRWLLSLNHASAATARPPASGLAASPTQKTAAGNLGRRKKARAQ